MTHPTDFPKLAADALEPETCDIGAKAFVAGETCAIDIELGMVHAECLEGSPIVDLDTGEPSDGPLSTFPYEALPAPAIPTETGQGFLGVKVRPLEWIGDDDSGYVAKTSIGTYEAWPVEDLVWGLCFEEKDIEGTHMSSDDAHFAAQADYSARILPAIDIPAPAGGEEAVGVLCEGCGSSWNDERLAAEKAKNPALRSCCPERRMRPVYAHPAPDHHLRVEVERLRADVAAREHACEMAWKSNRERQSEIEKLRAEQITWEALRLELSMRVTTAETRIAELEAAINDAIVTGSVAPLRSALASSNKPVEEGK